MPGISEEKFSAQIQARPCSVLSNTDKVPVPTYLTRLVLSPVHLAVQTAHTYLREVRSRHFLGIPASALPVRLLSSLARGLAALQQMHMYTRVRRLPSFHSPSFPRGCGLHTLGT